MGVRFCPVMASDGTKGATATPTSPAWPADRWVSRQRAAGAVRQSRKKGHYTEVGGERHPAIFLKSIALRNLC